MSEHNTNLKTILIVEDDFITVKLIENILFGICNLDETKTAHGAIEKAGQKQYELIIMDINLGKSENGMYATREIRKLVNYKDTPIVAMTAFTMLGDKDEFLRGGCTHYISKPINIEEFKDLIKEILSN